MTSSFRSSTLCCTRKGRRGCITRSLDACDENNLILSIAGLDVDLPSGIEEGTSFKTIQDIIDSRIAEGIAVIDLIKKNKIYFRNGLTAIEAAVMLGHNFLVNELLKEGVGVAYYLKEKHPLYIALERGHFSVASLLLKHDKSDAVNTHFYGIFPMKMALSRTDCSVEIVNDLIAAGFPENGIIDQRTTETALHIAVNMGHHKVIEYLLSQHSIDCDLQNSRGQTPLHYAVTKDCSVCVNMLTKHGANLNCECNYHITPLFNAISIGSCDMVNLLIGLGADINYVNGDKKCSMTPLYFAVRCCRLKITQVLLDHGADFKNPVPLTGETALHAAAVADTLNSQANKIGLDCIVEMLIKRGAEIDRKNMFGVTPLHLAIKNNRLSVATALIQNGADINSPMAGGTDLTCLHVACGKLDKDLIKLLVDNGADMYAKNEIGHPCHYAVAASMAESAEHGKGVDHTAIFKYLWSRGFPYDLTMRNRLIEALHVHGPPKLSALVQKQKLLFAGVKHQQIKSVCKAMAQGAELNCCSLELRYPLHYTAARGGEQILALLLYGRQPVNCLDKRSESALHVAARAGFVTCCRLLLENGAVYNHSNSKCPKTPLQLAQEAGHSEVVKMLTTIDKHFRDIRKKKFIKLGTDMRIYSAVVNCRDRNGRSIMETAIYHGANDAAERLMRLRLISKSSSQAYF